MSYLIAISIITTWLQSFWQYLHLFLLLWLLLFVLYRHWFGTGVCSSTTHLEVFCKYLSSYYSTECPSTSSMMHLHWSVILLFICVHIDITGDLWFFLWIRSYHVLLVLSVYIVVVLVNYAAYARFSCDWLRVRMVTTLWRSNAREILRCTFVSFKFNFTADRFRKR